MPEPVTADLIEPQQWLPATPAAALRAASWRLVPMWRGFDTMEVFVTLAEALRILEDDNPGEDEPGYRVICRPVRPDIGLFSALLYHADEGPAVRGLTGRYSRDDYDRRWPR